MIHLNICLYLSPTMSVCAAQFT